MSVHKKLQSARVTLQKIPMKKSGHNKFAGYYYFELSDFLEPIQVIFDELGLCGVVSFTETTATLTITDVEDERSISITCPMSKAALKGCHDVQNLGAVITYIRRYLWTTALEIVESDGVEAVTGKPIDPKIEKQRIADLLAERIALINGCTDMVTLANVFKQAWQDLGNADKAALTAAKDAKKTELTLPTKNENVDLETGEVINKPLVTFTNERYLKGAIDSCQDGKTISELWATVPADVKPKFQELFEIKQDLMR